MLFCGIKKVIISGNQMKLENKIFQEIWDLALPYQDKRDDEGHAEIVTEYAIKLCRIENADLDVVIPAAILHDIGWSKIPKEEATKCLTGSKRGNATERAQLRELHQSHGVKMANQILKKVEYDTNLVSEVLEIISQHDTREGFISTNEGVMRDADKLWRFTERAFIADSKRLRLSNEEAITEAENYLEIKDFFFSENAELIARQELKKRRREL